MQINNCVEQCPSWEANSRSAAEEISRFMEPNGSLRYLQPVSEISFVAVVKMRCE
jgi:hypothetical protein